MRIAVIILCGLSCAAWLGLSGGCKSKKERHAEMMLQTPLELDPTENIEISRWWTNGRELLLLETDGGYSLFAGPGRHSEELERGRWAQQNYATLWLEPYSAQSSERVRVQVAKQDGALVLMVPRHQTFKPINSPPMTMEDRVIGRWLGSMGELRLMANRRYELVPADRPGAAADALPPMIQRGAWSVAGDELTLQPETRGATALNLKIVVDQNHVALNAPGSGGLFTRAK